MDMRQITTAEMCLDADEAARSSPRSRQMANSNAVVHAVRPISVAEDARQGDPSLIVTGKLANIDENAAFTIKRKLYNHEQCIKRNEHE